ncbi:MAG: transcriptional repressor LexA [Acutalibacteraceae bacterium]|nr:transcriptional repressor LexA [Acutalibacteraceae bacterium]
MPKLTKSQQKVYDYLIGRIDDGVPPSVREICEATGFKSTSTVHAHLNSLEKLGLINRQSGCTRAIRVMREDNPPKAAAVPIIGTVTAGVPIYAYQDYLGYITVDESIKRGRELFALKVKGDSMINAGILNGDAVVFVSQSVAENGDIVVALIGDEATVKRFYKEKDSVRLQPENPLYEPIISDNVQILGKVVTLVRNYE